MLHVLYASSHLNIPSIPLFYRRTRAVCAGHTTEDTILWSAPGPRGEQNLYVCTYGEKSLDPYEFTTLK